MKIGMSAVVLTKNEEKNIVRCLNSLDFCGEIVVVDDNSGDSTTAKAKKRGALVFARSLAGDFASQRNYAMGKAKNEWVLFVDADEEVSPELAREITEILRSPDADAYYVKRRDYWWNTNLRYGEVGKVYRKGIVRLVRKDAGTWMGNVHEVFHTAKKVKSLSHFINHYPHPSVADFLSDINAYSTVRARELFGHGRSSSIFEIMTVPFAKFVLNYFFYFGFLDGPAGFAYAFFMSFHSFLVRAKLYQMQLHKINPR